jgi:nicotinate-nucleotide adenylyltransferase
MAAARASRDQLGLQRVLLVVANLPWQKVPRQFVSRAADRLAMVQEACKNEDRIEASAREIERGGDSYTVDTVEALLAESGALGAPDPEIFLVVGADLVPTLPTWHRADDLRSLVTLAVVPRPQGPQASELSEVVPGWHTRTVHGVDLDVSSSEVRRRLLRGEPVDGMVPEAVIRCIQRRGLYAGGR